MIVLRYVDADIVLAIVSCMEYFLVELSVFVDGSLHSRKRDIGDTILSFVRMREKYGEVVGFVKMSARLSMLEMNRTSKFLEATLSQTK